MNKAEIIINLIEECMKRVGTYKLNNKGLGEFCDTGYMTKLLEECETGQEAGAILLKVLNDDRIADVAWSAVSHLVSSLDGESEDWFDGLLEADELAKLYG